MRGLVWVQGEEDSKNNIAATYESKQTALFNGIRSHVSVPNLKIVDGLLRGEFASYVYTPQLNQAKANVAAALGNVKTVRSSAFDDVGDDVHYNWAAQLALGRHAYEYLYSVSWALPAAVPARVFELDVSRQEGFDTSALLKVGTVFDHSGSGRDFSQAVASKTPGVVEGPLGLGMGTLRFVSPNALDGPVNPFATDSSFTLYFVIANFAAGSGVRTVLRSLGSGSWLLWYPNTGATDKIALRGRGSQMIVQSSVATASAPQVRGRVVRRRVRLVYPYQRRRDGQHLHRPWGTKTAARPCSSATPTPHSPLTSRLSGGSHRRSTRRRRRRSRRRSPGGITSKTRSPRHILFAIRHRCSYSKAPFSDIRALCSSPYVVFAIYKQLSTVYQRRRGKPTASTFALLEVTRGTSAPKFRKWAIRQR